MLDAAYLLRWSPHPPLTLLADADDRVRSECATFLSNSGCAVDEAEDGRIALARALTTRVDILIAAEPLPGLDAAHLAEILRADSTTRAVPIVVTNAAPDHVESLRSVGADVVLVGRPRPESIALEMQQLITRSAQMRERAAAVRSKAQKEIARGTALIERSLKHRRATMSRAHNRGYTQSPVLAPPALVCPTCDKPLRYEYSHTGGVNVHQNEQWDYFVCSSGCGTFQFRHRTNKLRKVY